LEAIAVEVETLCVWQHAVPKLVDRILVEPTLAPLSVMSVSALNVTTHETPDDRSRFGPPPSNSGAPGVSAGNCAKFAPADASRVDGKVLRVGAEKTHGRFHVLQWRRKLTRLTLVFRVISRV
jgi:hypothetical protein